MEYDLVLNLKTGEILRFANNDCVCIFIKTSATTARQLFVKPTTISLGDAIEISQLFNTSWKSVEVFEEHERSAIKTILFKLFIKFEEADSIAEIHKLITELNNILFN